MYVEYLEYSAPLSRPAISTPKKKKHLRNHP
jgi:hypothetical protein